MTKMTVKNKHIEYIVYKIYIQSSHTSDVCHLKYTSPQAYLIFFK